MIRRPGLIFICFVHPVVIHVAKVGYRNRGMDDF